MNSRIRAFTIMELMVVIMIVSVLAATALPTLSRYLRRAKTTEAALNLRKIYDGEVAYYIEEHVSSTGATFSPKFIPLAPQPAFPPGVQKKSGDFEHGGWPQIKFSPDGASLYCYMVDTPTNNILLPQPIGVPQLPEPGPDWIDAFVARAMGDVDGDGVFSLFERLGIVTSSSGGQPQGGASLFVWDDLE